MCAKKKQTTVGHPLKFESVEELQELIDKYFENCDKNNRPYTITGLAVALDTDRITLLQYEKGNEEDFKRLDEDERKAYSNTMKRAKQKIQNYAEEQLFRNGQVAGVIFNMKNNWGWVDKQEIVTTNNNINITLEDDK